jgi:NAD(P)-dependent dehydrogenase (short-subunit alcohol dehydrogenase family)
MAGLKGKIAVVTGGGRGIGRAVAIRLAQEGAAVAVNYRSDRESATAVVDELTDHGHRAVAIQADVSDPDQTGRLMDQAAERLGGLGILVSNAGIEHFGALAEITPADFDRVFATNTRGQLSKFSSLPSISTASVPLPFSIGGLPARAGGGSSLHSLSAALKIAWISRRTLAISPSKSDGRMPGGYGL